MNLTKLKQILIAALMMISFSVVCQSQTILQRLDDGSIAVEIDGLKYLAITPAQKREWEKLQKRADFYENDNKELIKQISTLEHEKELLQKDAQRFEEKALSFETDFKRARTDAERNWDLFVIQRDIATDAMQFIPHGKVGGFGGKFLNFLDGPVGQSLFKLVIPTAQFIKVMKQ